MIQVAPDALSNVWPTVSPWIADAINRRECCGDENLLDVLIAIARGYYALWVEPNEFAAVVQIVNYPRHRVGCILYAGGRLEAFITLFEEAKVFAKANKIDVIRVWGRPGWERALGLKRVGVILQYEVSA